jgi:hypothetical protein
VAEAEHRIEDRMKRLAREQSDQLGDPEGLARAADEISDRGDEHLMIAERIDGEV